MNGSSLDALVLSLTLTLVHVLWIGVVIALADGAVAWCLRRAPASSRYVAHVAALVLLAVSLPATFALVALEPSPPATSLTSRVASTRAESPPARVQVAPQPIADNPAADSPVLSTPVEINEARAPNPSAQFLATAAPYVAVAYLLGVAVMLARLGVGLWGGRQLRLSGMAATDPELLGMATRQARRIGLRLVPVVAWCDRIAVPLVVGVLKPTILLPAALATGFEPRQLELLLAHELAHVRRFDLWINLLQRLVEAVLFFHPAAWYLSRRVSLEREIACDDLVLAGGNGRVQYAEALLGMAERSFALRGLSLPGSAVFVAATGESPTQFKRRILRLLESEGTPRPQLTGRGLLMGIIAGGLILGSLAMFSASARPPGPPPDRANGVAVEPESKASQNPRTLVKADVLDAQTGMSVRVFRVIPGVPFTSIDSPGRALSATWQPHLLKEGVHGRFEWPMERSYDQFLLRIEAEGYIPAFSPWINKTDGPRSIVVAMRKDPLVSGRVLRPDGQPAAGAVLAIALPNREIHLKDGKFAGSDEPVPQNASDRWRRTPLFQADFRGHYRLPTEPGTAKVYAVHDSGIAETDYESLSRSGEIRLQEWAALDGQVLWIDKPGAHESVQLSTSRNANGYPVFSHFQSLQSDVEGRFHATKLPPWKVQVARTFDLPNGVHYPFPYLHVDLSNRTGSVSVVLGGRGRPLVGKLTGRNSYDGVTLSIRPNTPSPSDEIGMLGYRQVRQSNIGAAFFRDRLAVNQDGTFRIPSVLPGPYELFVQSELPTRLTRLARKFDVSAPAVDSPESPHDLGEIVMAPPANQVAPKKNRVVDAQGKPIAKAKVELLPHVLEPKDVLATFTADDQGRFEYPKETPESGHFYVQISAPGFVTDKWIGNFEVQKTAPREFKLSRISTISGRVLGTDGKPLAGVPLTLDSETDRAATLGRKHLASDAEGRFLFEGLPAGKFYIRYRRWKDKGDPVPLPVQLAVVQVTAVDGKDVSDVTLDLSKATGVVEGRVFDAKDQGIANAHIRVHRAIAQRLDHSISTKTGEDGRFRVEGLIPGEYQVRAMGSLIGGGLGHPQMVTVKPGEPASVTIAGYSGGQPPPKDRKVEPKWGPTHEGLQAALVFDPDKPAYAIGDVVKVQALVRNMTREPIEFKDTHSFNALQITRPDKQVVQFDYLRFTGLPWSELYRLEPGNELLLKGAFQVSLSGKEGEKGLFDLPVESGQDYKFLIRFGTSWNDVSGAPDKQRVTGEAVLHVK